MPSFSEEKDKIMRDLDQDESGTVDFYEFLQFIAKIRITKGYANSPATQLVKKGFVTRVCSIQ